MGGYRQRRVSDLRDEIERGTYTVDPHAVADAIIRRIQELAVANAVTRRATSR